MSDIAAPKTTKTNRAQVATVTIAGQKFQGVMFPDGSYGITIQQAHQTLTEGLSQDKSHISIHQNNAQRDLKALLGKENPFIKEHVENHARSQNILSLSQFWQLIRKLDRKGNPRAEAFVDACGETTLEMYLDVAFNVEREAKERVTWNEVRAAGILTRNKATDALRDYMHSIGEVPEAKHYIQLTEALNKAVLGFTAAQYKKAHGLETKTNMRELLNQQQLKALDFAEELFVRLLHRTNDFKVALAQTIETLA